MEYSEIKALAVTLGIFTLENVDLEDYASVSDGCSGGLSKLYALLGLKMSCHKVCVAHDYLYDWGGTAKDRKKADILLRIGAGRPKPEWSFIRKIWRQYRAWVMYFAVRIFGKCHWCK